MIPQTWKKTTSNSRNPHRLVEVASMTRQAPSLVPVWEKRRGDHQHEAGYKGDLKVLTISILCTKRPAVGPKPRSCGTSSRKLEEKTRGGPFFPGDGVELLHKSSAKITRTRPDCTLPSLDEKIDKRRASEKERAGTGACSRGAFSVRVASRAGSPSSTAPSS
jgi:hypothetical protein